MSKSSPNIWTRNVALVLHLRRRAGQLLPRLGNWISPLAVIGPLVAVAVGPGVAFSQTAGAPDLAVTEVRLGVHPDSTRFVIELSGNVVPRIFGLPDPFRVVIDLPEVRFDLAPGAADAAAGVVQKMRYGQFRPGTSRLVIDLSEPAKVKRHFVMEPQNGDTAWRLVVDLETTDRQDFIDTMRPVQQLATVSPPPLLVAPNADAGDNGGPLTVVIDPGHGGIDPGAVGPKGTREKDLVLEYARAIRTELQTLGDYQVVLTRDDDVFLPLRDRVTIARRAQADLFLSLHANTNDDNRVAGFSAYTLSERGSDKEAVALAAAENKSDVIGGVDLDQFDNDVATILIDFAQTKTNELSISFAREELLQTVADRAQLLPRPLRSAGFAVLKAPDVPSVLIELGHITNPKEASLLNQEGHRHNLSAAIADAVDRHFRKIRAARRS